MVLSIICFCKWWWLLWLLPFILGWLLGKAMNSSWKSKAENLEGELANCRSKCNRLEKDLEECRSKKKVASASTKSSSASSITATTAAAATPIAAATSAPKDTGGEKKSAAWAKLKSNNMQIIEGIGPKMNEVLNDNGISSWSVLAGKSRDELKAILDKYGDKYKIIEPGDWPNQAKLAAEDKWEELYKYQSDDGSPSKAKNLMIKLGIIKDDQA